MKIKEPICEIILSENLYLTLDGEERKFVYETKSESPYELVVTEYSTLKSLYELSKLIGSKICFSFIHEATQETLKYLGKIIKIRTYIGDDNVEMLEYVIHYEDVEYHN